MRPWAQYLVLKRGGRSKEGKVGQKEGRKKKKKNIQGENEKHTVLKTLKVNRGPKDTVGLLHSPLSPSALRKAEVTWAILRAYVTNQQKQIAADKSREKAVGHKGGKA